MKNKRQDHELPEATTGWGWKYHHLGIPTDKIMPEEAYLPEFRVFVSGFGSSPFGIEWMRFEKGSTVNDLIRTYPHLAFVVRDLDQELADRKLKILTAPNSPSENLRVAMVEHNGAPVELMEFKISEFPDK